MKVTSSKFERASDSSVSWVTRGGDRSGHVAPVPRNGVREVRGAMRFSDYDSHNQNNFRLPLPSSFSLPILSFFFISPAKEIHFRATTTMLVKFDGTVTIHFSSFFLSSTAFLTTCGSIEHAEKVHKAAKHGNWGELLSFRGLGYDLTAKDRFSKTPLHTGLSHPLVCFRLFFLNQPFSLSSCCSCGVGAVGGGGVAGDEHEGGN